MSTITPLRAVISARVSVDDFGKGKKTREEQQREASMSIQGQIDAGAKLIRDAGYIAVCDPLIDDGVSGFKGAERKGFDTLVRMIIRKEIDVVVTRAVDRIGRNDVENSKIRQAATDAGVRFHLTTGGIIDPRESTGKLNMQVLQGIAEYQSALKSETLRNVYGAMRDRGELRSGHKAFGWQWQKGKPELSMRAEPGERKLVQEAYRRVLTKESLYAVCADWNARGIPSVTGKAWSITAMRSMLLRPSNALFIRTSRNGWDYDETVDAKTGKVRRGQWDRLIDDESYAAARLLLLSPSRRTAPGRKHVHLVSGIVKCGVCGAPLRSSSVDDKKGGRMPIYRCVNKMSMPTDPGVKHVSARVETLDAAVRRAVVSAFVFGPQNLFPDDTPSRETEIHHEIDALIRNRQEVLSLVADGLVSPSDVRGQLNTLKAREAALRANLTDATPSDADSMRLTDLRAGLWNGERAEFAKAAEYADALGARFDALEIERRRALVRHLLDVEVRPLGPGVYGSRRWKIEHAVVTHLNDEHLEEA